jgi:uncharacterized membrane protein YkvA (DUF1232 family)
MSEVRQGEILGPDLDPRAEAKVRRGFWPTVRRAARQIPFMHDVVAAYFCAVDPNTPLKVRGTILGALVYFVSPVDAVLDFIPLVGFGDDAAILIATIKLVADHITDEHRAKAARALAD